MKLSHIILGVPALFFVVLALTLDLGALLVSIPEYDLTPYLAARSLISDGDLAYTREDSDRYFRRYLYRPGHFKVAEKKIIGGDGSINSYYVFYEPSLYTFCLVPFAPLGLNGVLLFHALLIGALFFTGFWYYAHPLRDNTRPEGPPEDAVLPALNSVIYYTLVLTPILFAILSQHLFLLTTVSLGLFFGLRKQMLLSAIFFSAAVSSQPFALVAATLIAVYWIRSDTKSDALKFVFLIGAGILIVWGAERLMYPPSVRTGVRWIDQVQPTPLNELWDRLPRSSSYLFNRPDFQILTDFIFGRTTGIFLYGFAGFAIWVGSMAYWRDKLILRAFAVLFLLLAIVLVAHESSWNLTYFTNDFSILFIATAFFLAPFIRPVTFFLPAVIGSLLFAAPLLVNPAGAFLSSAYYLQSAPYRFFPVELGFLHKIGLAKNPVFQLRFDGGTLYLLNDQFYPEKDFLWVHGDSKLEFLLEIADPSAVSHLKIINGELENQIVLKMGKEKQEFWMKRSETAHADLSESIRNGREYRGRTFVHGTITSSAGYVPRLLSRDNVDYRYLGCQIQPVQSKKNQ